jgi:hypothetical protein
MGLVGSALYRWRERRALRAALQTLVGCRSLCVIVDPRDSSDPLWPAALAKLRRLDDIRIVDVTTGTKEGEVLSRVGVDACVVLTEPAFIQKDCLAAVRLRARQASGASLPCGIRLGRLYRSSQRGRDSYLPAAGESSELSHYEVPWCADLVVVSCRLLRWLGVECLVPGVSEQVDDVLSELAASALDIVPSAVDCTLIPRRLAAKGEQVSGALLVTDGTVADTAPEECTFARNRLTPSPSVGDSVESQLALAVVIMATPGDLQTLGLCIESIREYLRHPLSDVVVVSPDVREIKDVAGEHGCSWVHEDSVLPIAKSDIDYSVDGVDRSGWLFQQLLKLAFDARVKDSHYLVVDADTVLVRQQVFCVGGREVKLLGDFFHKPYFDVYERLLGEAAHGCHSYVAHQMLFSCDKLRALKSALETRHNCSWYEAIIACTDRSNASGFSEYETYGQFCQRHFPDSCQFEYFRNLELAIDDLEAFATGRYELPDEVRSVSFQQYDRRVASQRVA